MHPIVRRCLPGLCAAILSLPLRAMDTPLVLFSGAGMGTVNAASGQVAIYDLRERSTERKSIANFLADLNRLELESAGVAGYTALRTGWPGGSGAPKPTPEELIRQFRKEPTPEQRTAGTGGDQELVRKAEDEFWSKERPYDGVVRAALGSQLLMVVVPAKRVALFYKVDNQRLTLSASYNYSPALYVQLAMNSQPDPLAIVRQLDLPKDQQEQLVGAFHAQEGGGIAAAATSEVWCCAAGTLYALLDTANQRLLLFEDMGKAVALRAVRNLAADLMIPVGFNSGPNASAEAAELPRRSKDAAALIKEFGLEPFDQYALKAFAGLAVAPRGASGRQEVLQANCSEGNNPQVVLDLLPQRKLLVYNLRGAGNSLELASVRDYSFDVAVDALLTRVGNRANGVQLLRRAGEQAGKGDGAVAVQNLSAALRLDPGLVEQARKLPALRKLKGGDQERAEAILAAADKVQEAERGRLEAVAKAAAAERAQAKGDKDKAARGDRR